MFQKIDLNKLFFLDIETVTNKATFDELSDTEKELSAQILLRLRNETLLEANEITHS